ncbi:hypothetical protein FIBSPDRAFT_320857 [Athelia psychrophila]|uniref:Uncharacterized protein n=1 Tax=Athelia psychrophila TaxID=1759441 RepID=A0A166QI83_9AGAM|nr:hypothetical protein FIBSPDRAFT_320857 [Fibularhizoctonia sp. CBS 109695]
MTPSANDSTAYRGRRCRHIPGVLPAGDRGWLGGESMGILVVTRAIQTRGARYAIDCPCAPAKKHSIYIIGTIVERQMKSAPTTTWSVTKPTTPPFSHLHSKTTHRPDSATQESWRDNHID